MSDKSTDMAWEAAQRHFELGPGELLQLRGSAAQLDGWRARPGYAYLTNKRLVFCRNGFWAFALAPALRVLVPARRIAWQAKRADLSDAVWTPHGRGQKLKVRLPDGTTRDLAVTKQAEWQRALTLGDAYPSIPNPPRSAALPVSLALLTIAALGGAALYAANEFGLLQTAKGPAGWTYSDTRDPISGDLIATATHRFQPDQTPASYADVELTCHAKAGAAPDPFALTLTLTALGAQAKGGELPPAKLADGSLDYRIDDLGGGSLEESAGTASRYNNEFRFSFAALYGASPQVSERLTKASGGVGGLVEIGALAGQAAAAEQGGPVDAGALRGAQLNEYLSNTALRPMLQPALANVSNGFAWPFSSVTLRYKATVGEGTGEYVVTVPLNDPAVVKVANACGWGTGAFRPAPTPIAAAATSPPPPPSSNTTSPVASTADADEESVPRDQAVIRPDATAPQADNQPREKNLDDQAPTRDRSRPNDPDPR